MKQRKPALWGIIILALAALLLFTACGAPQTETPSPSAQASATADQAETPESAAPATNSGNPKVEIEMADGGKILVELDPAAAPETVENFLKLAGEGYYDGLIFHRVIPGFMIQGGDPDGTGMGGPGYGITGEFASNGWDNPISHVRGVISMARSGDPNSAGSQFFITNADSTFLDGDYAAFGTVLDGMDEVDKISAVETDASDKPLEDVAIKTIRVVA